MDHFGADFGAPKGKSGFRGAKRVKNPAIPTQFPTFPILTLVDWNWKQT
ncbi:hypothetical protein Taro_017546 [Colocasia esculenta]|uniref:Uncharacterized protein n=1 Tax=Colocasia esculenta TaxID=4460 RepID=A0A843UZQ0_COLES|nr:hypothetical protein [Colocasia esculenta]